MAQIGAAMKDRLISVVEDDPFFRDSMSPVTVELVLQFVFQSQAIEAGARGMSGGGDEKDGPAGAILRRPSSAADDALAVLPGRLGRRAQICAAGRNGHHWSALVFGSR